MKQTLYFAYGSNLDPNQMRRRCPTSRAVGPATLHGRRLAFGGHSQRWGGPVATLLKDRSGFVDGMLHALPLDELAMLDGCEGHPSRYRRKLLLVSDEAGKRRRAHVYVLPITVEAPPAPAYLDVLWKAYTRLGFDLEALTDAAGGAQ